MLSKDAASSEAAASRENSAGRELARPRPTLRPRPGAPRSQVLPLTGGQPSNWPKSSTLLSHAHTVTE